MGASSGQYLTIGGVVSEVNGTPIYANKVLTLVEPVLAAGAKQYDAQRFRQFAIRQIRDQIEDLEYRQVEYAAAERNLDQKEKDLADTLTTNWKQQQIREAGGSLELARHAAVVRGEDFEELTQEQYRKFMSQIYYQKKRFPRIQVSAADMRAYYEHNRDREFNDRGVAQFRLIRIDVRKHDGRDKAWQLINELRNRIIKAGESFESIARSVNDDPLLLRNGGDVGKIEQNSFKIEKVDQAVWNTPDGQVTPVIDTGDAFYIAQVLEKKPGKILPFEDETVQQRISDRLYAEQFRNLREDEKRKLLGEAIVRSDPVMINTALEMAMQNYRRWAAK
jgi:parvulin-like peptidyl-prolyl isomerase